MLSQARSTNSSGSFASADLTAGPLHLPSYYEILESSPKLNVQSILSTLVSSPPRTPSDSDTSSVGPAPSRQTPAVSKKKVHKKRKRTGRACVYCQKLHLSCDEQRPCSRCTKAGREDQCRDGKRKRRGRKRKNAPIEDEMEQDDCCSDEQHSSHSHGDHSHHHDIDADEFSQSSAENDDTMSTISNDSSFIDKRSPPPKRSKPINSPGFHEVSTYDDEAVEAAALLLTFHNVASMSNHRRQVRVF